MIVHWHKETIFMHYKAKPMMLQQQIISNSSYIYSIAFHFFPQLRMYIQTQIICNVYKIPIHAKCGKIVLMTKYKIHHAQLPSLRYIAVWILFQILHTPKWEISNISFIKSLAIHTLYPPASLLTKQHPVQCMGIIKWECLLWQNIVGSIQVMR